MAVRLFSKKWNLGMNNLSHYCKMSVEKHLQLYFNSCIATTNKVCCLFFLKSGEISINSFRRSSLNLFIALRCLWWGQARVEERVWNVPGPISKATSRYLPEVPGNTPEKPQSKWSIIFIQSTSCRMEIQPPNARFLSIIFTRLRSKHSAMICCKLIFSLF